MFGPEVAKVATNSIGKRRLAPGEPGLGDAGALWCGDARASFSILLQEIVVTR